MLNCNWSCLAKGCECLNNCGYALKRDYDKPPNRECKAPNTRRESPASRAASEQAGLGDRIEAALTAVGVTKERWQAFKGLLGLPRTCDCTARREYLNKLGETLGAAARTTVENMLGFGSPDNKDN